MYQQRVLLGMVVLKASFKFCLMYFSYNWLLINNCFAICCGNTMKSLSRFWTEFTTCLSNPVVVSVANSSCYFCLRTTCLFPEFSGLKELLIWSQICLFNLVNISLPQEFALDGMYIVFHWIFKSFSQKKRKFNIFLNNLRIMYLRLLLKL